MARIHVLLLHKERNIGEDGLFLIDIRNNVPWEIARTSLNLLVKFLLQIP
jgi:hypothetical protein